MLDLIAPINVSFCFNKFLTVPTHENVYYLGLAIRWQRGSDKFWIVSCSRHAKFFV